MNLDHIASPNRMMAPVWWYGGKGNMAAKLVRHIDPIPAKVYVEPYCGAASVFWHCRSHDVEVLNDIDGRIVNLFRVLQDPEGFEKFRHRVEWTPYSLDEFRRALSVLADSDPHPLESAWAFYVAQNQGFSGVATTEGNWSRVFVSSRGMAINTNTWRGRMKMLQHWHDRLTRVQIDHRDALEVIRYWDSPDTLFYLDPPYVMSTRAAGHHDVYAKEADDDHHSHLVELLLSIDGKAVLSGYKSALYAPLESAGWERVDYKTVCHAASHAQGGKNRGAGSAMATVPRVESVWISSRAQELKLI